MTEALKKIQEVKMEKLKVSDIYSSYLDDINVLQKENKELVAKCNQLEKKLDIAINVLAAYSDTENWKVSNMWTGTYYGYTLAKDALEVIEEVKC